MNNNNNRNNRRRGRGNRNQSGNGSQLNRIDSRARGNAPQMLDKYKKLAQDAHHNGDRVQMEYYLQFADHYFRVIADNKARVDEQRGGPRRNDERDQAEEYGDDDMDFDRNRRSEPSSRTRYDQQDSDSRGDMSANGFEGEPGQEGEPFLSDDRDDDRSNERGNDRGGDRDDSQQQQRQPAARRQQRKPRDDNRAERPERAERAERTEARPERAERAERPARTERTERPAKRAEQAEAKPARARKPRPPLADDRAKDVGSIDSSILPPSIRGDDSDRGSGDSDGTLETVG